jgi:hypothetical protein
MLSRFATSIFALASTGCSAHPQIEEAWYTHSSSSNVVIHVEVDARDARSIKLNQLYFSIVLEECGTGATRFPMEPFVGGERASHFDFNTSGSVDFTAESPSWVISKYRVPCVALEGGAYTGVHLKSAQVVLQKR